MIYMHKNKIKHVMYILPRDRQLLEHTFRRCSWAARSTKTAALPTFIVLVGLLVFGSIWLFAHLPSLLFDWSSPRNVVPPFFTMCLSMSTAAQL